MGWDPKSDALRRYLYGLGITGAAVDFDTVQQFLNNLGVNTDQMGSAYTGAPEATGPGMDQDAKGELGVSRRTYACTMVRGRRKKINSNAVAKNLILRNHQLYQLFNYSQATSGFKSNGYLSLAAKYQNEGESASSPAATILFPVYVFRMNVPNGMQEGGLGYTPPVPPATEGTWKTLLNSHFIAPNIGYRLVGTRTALGGPIHYRWEDLTDLGLMPPLATSGWNVDQTFIPGGPTDKNLNCAGIYMGDGIPNCTRYCHQVADCQVLFTGAKNLPVDVKCCVVNFAQDDFAPPDEGTYFGENFTDNTYSGTNGSRIRTRGNIMAFGTGQGADDNVLDAILTPYLHAKSGHPCHTFVQEPGVIEKKAWYETSKFTTTLTGIVNTTLDQNPVQYKHRLIVRPNRWFNSNCEPDNVRPHQSVVDPRITPMNTSRANGIYPRVNQERWLMVSAWNNEPVKAYNAAFSNTTDPSFDISIKYSFAFARDLN